MSVSRPRIGAAPVTEIDVDVIGEEGAELRGTGLRRQAIDGAAVDHFRQGLQSRPDVRAAAGRNQKIPAGDGKGGDRQDDDGIPPHQNTTLPRMRFSLHPAEVVVPHRHAAIVADHEVLARAEGHFLDVPGPAMADVRVRRGSSR